MSIPSSLLYTQYFLLFLITTAGVLFLPNVWWSPHYENIPVLYVLDLNNRVLSACQSLSVCLYVSLSLSFSLCIKWSPDPLRLLMYPFRKMILKNHIYSRIVMHEPILQHRTEISLTSIVHPCSKVFGIYLLVSNDYLFPMYGFEIFHAAWWSFLRSFWKISWVHVIAVRLCAHPNLVMFKKRAAKTLQHGYRYGDIPMLYDTITTYEWFFCYNWHKLCSGNKLLDFSSRYNFLVKYAI